MSDLDIARRFGILDEDVMAAQDRVKAARSSLRTTERRAIAGAINDSSIDVGEAASRLNRRAEDIARPDEVHLADGRTWGDVGKSFLHEMVKSYGIRHDFETGQWSFSLANVKKSWDESKGWFLFDWATLLAAPLKVGVMAAKVGKGAGVGGRILKEARTGNAAAQAVLAQQKGAGRIAGAFMTDDFSKAVALQSKQSSLGGKLGRFIRNPVADRNKAEIDGIITALGVADPQNARSLANAHINEWLGRSNAALIEQKQITERLALVKEKLLGEGGEAAWTSFEKQFDKAMRMGDDARGARLMSQFGDNAAWSFQKTADFRRATHEMMHELGVITREEFEAGAGYWPSLPKMAKGRGAFGSKAARAQLGKVGKTEPALGRAARMMKKTKDLPPEARLMDPSLQLDELMNAYQSGMRTMIGRNLASSAVAKSGDDLIASVAAADETVAKVNGWAPEMVEEARGLSTATAAAKRDFARRLGWKTYNEAFGKSQKGIKKGVAAQLKQSGLADMMIDPHAADEIEDFFKVWSSEGMKFANLHKLYYRSLRAFRATKTAYNPATWVRNHFGNVMFHNLATGQAKLHPHRGVKAYMAKGDELIEAAKHGVVGSTEIEKFHKLLGDLVGDDYSKSALDFIVPDSKVGGKIKRLAKMSEDGYQMIDEIWKLDAWLSVRDDALKAGSSAAEAGQIAAEKVAQFMPMFNRLSPAAQGIGLHIPFSSFTAEAVRVWKNAVMLKPHLAYMWAHMFTGMSHASAVAAGISPEEMEEAKRELPGHTQGKPLLMLPFRIDGKVEFLDMSQILPLGANFSQAGRPQEERAGILGPLSEFFDPTANPFLGFTMAAITGVDPWSGMEIKGRATQHIAGQLGVGGVGGGKVSGLAEYALRAALPPMVPPGYAGTNALEYVFDIRGAEAQSLEDSAVKMVAANFAGLRTYRPNILNRIRNDKARRRAIEGEAAALWADWKVSYANGYTGRMEALTQELGTVAALLGKDPVAYLMEGVQSHKPMDFGNMSNTEIRNTLASAGGTRDAYERQLLSELFARQITGVVK